MPFETPKTLTRQGAAKYLGPISVLKDDGDTSSGNRIELPEEDDTIYKSSIKILRALYFSAQGRRTTPTLESLLQKMPPKVMKHFLKFFTLQLFLNLEIMKMVQFWNMPNH